MNAIIMIIVAIGILWGLSIFLGVIGGLSKNMTHNPQAIDSSQLNDREQQTIEDTQAKQQKLMDDMKQKMDDEGQKF